MHPDALAALGERFAAQTVASLGEGATLTADAALDPADCVVRSVGGTVDGRLAARLDRIAAELLPAEEPDGDAP